MSPPSDNGGPGNAGADQWDDDGPLLRDLGDAVRLLPPAPSAFVTAAGAAWAWRTIDAELAELSYDSATDPAPVTRSARPVRTLAFDSDGISIELELTDTGITGQLAPAGAARITAETTSGVFAETSVDEIGCFLLAAPPAGPFRLSARGERFAVVTPWIRWGQRV